MSCRFERFEPWPGGSYRMILTYSDASNAPGKTTTDSDIVDARFVELVPGVRVVQSVDFESHDPAYAGTMTMTWSLVDVDSGTRVEFRAENVPTGISEEDHAAGLASSLKNLAAYIERERSTGRRRLSTRIRTDAPEHDHRRQRAAARPLGPPGISARLHRDRREASDRRRYQEGSMSQKKDTQEPAESDTATGAKSEGFTDEERAAMKDRAQELKAESRRGRRAKKADGESDLLAKIAEMQASDRAMAERLHAIITASAPSLLPRTWYGMPAYAKDGKVLCFFQSAQKFKTRYATLGFTDEANLDEGTMWPTSFALKELTAADEARIAALVEKAVS
jgi:uncharacterized protein YdhG (YjbR/CyaY superfamily)/uncharacterized protein YndB with AHSA1/START domain